MSREILVRAFNEGIKPHAEDIAGIGLAGHVAVVVFEPHEVWAKQALPTWGWRGEIVFPMPRQVRQALARTDPVTKAWIGKKWTVGDPLRIFVIVHRGTLLMNYTPGLAFSLEPGSTHFELEQWRGTLN